MPSQDNWRHKQTPSFESANPNACSQLNLFDFICSINNSFRLYILGRDPQACLLLVHIFCGTRLGAGGGVTNDPRVPSFAFLPRVAQHSFEQKTGCTWMCIGRQGTKCTNLAQWHIFIRQCARRTMSQWANVLIGWHWWLERI